jgi:hypothetical protein
MELPPDAKLFTQKIAWQNQRIILIAAPKLQESIELQWRSIVAARPRVDEGILIQILVEDLFDRLSAPSVRAIESDYWRSFIACSALQVAQRISKIVSTRPEDLAEIQSICLANMSHPDRFLMRFDRRSSVKSDLVASLKAYVYKSIQYSAYPEVRKTFNDPNIGRSSLGLFNRYSNSVIQAALINNSIDRSQIDRDLNLCQCAREYLRQTGKRVDRLVATDFDLIGDLYREITGDLPPPVAERLATIGIAIAKFTALRITSASTPLSSKISALNYTLEDTLASDKPQPEEYLEMQDRSQQWQQVFQLGNRWSIDRTDIHERYILLLRYGFDLNQTPIGSILKRDQASICRSLRQIHRRIAEHLTRSINPDPHVSSTMAIPSTIELLVENFRQFDLYQQIDLPMRQELTASISALKLWIKQPENRGRSLDPELIDRIRRGLTGITHK